MTAGSRRWERALRRRIRRAVRAAPLLRQEYKAARRAARRLSEGGRRALYPLFVVALWYGYVSDMGVAAGVALLTLWMTACAFTQASHLGIRLQHPWELAVLRHWPLSDTDLFHWQWRTFLRGASWGFYDFGLATLILLAAAPAGWAALGPALAVVALQAMLVPALATHLRAFVPRWRHDRIGLALGLTAFTLAMFREHTTEALAVVGAAVTRLTPAGWAHHAWQHGAQDATALLLLLPVAGLILSTRRSMVRLRHEFLFGDVDPQAAVEFGLAHGSQGGSAADAGEGAAPGPTELEERIRARAFLEPAAWEAQGWLERLIWKRLTPRERLVVEFHAEPSPGWTGRLKWSFVSGALATAIVAAFGQPVAWVIGLGAVLSAAPVLPVLGGAWRGFNLCQTGGVFAPVHSAVPLGFAEIARVLFKVNAVRFAAAAPLLFGFGAVLGWRLGGAAAVGLVLVAKVLGLIAALHPLAVLLRFAQGTNDTERMKWRWALLLIPLVLALAVTSILLFTLEGVVPALVALALAACLSWLAFWLYARAYQRGRFDLLTRHADEGAF